ncbi:MAG: hypothetical protein QNJ63_21765 [Calothrix sp. MO_192.B10]|nr:hypothetical protein [Calothrix sp. MO_192.B10]
MWEEGFEQKIIPSQEHSDKYLKDVMQGTGYPSLWLPSCDDDLEKIALGIALGRKSLDSVRLVGFEKSCFQRAGIQVKQVNDPSFPIPSVSSLHYELQTSDKDKLINSIQFLLQGKNYCQDFPKANPKNNNNIRAIAAKYIDEVAPEYQEKARKFAGSYLE